MIMQLSTSLRLSQLYDHLKFNLMLRHHILIWLLIICCSLSPQSRSQSSHLELTIEPLTTVDRQFMDNQRDRVEQLANQLGRRLTGNIDRDIDTLQRLIDGKLVTSSDKLMLQAIGVVFGDLLKSRLKMDWVIYRDKLGRSRALSFLEAEIYVFPITMISRRLEAGSKRQLKSLFNETVSKTKPYLPGSKWFNH